jgi:nitrite reductase/ring-hydroxylating ferredoxin subunit
VQAPILDLDRYDGVPFPVATVAELRRDGRRAVRAMGRDLLVLWNAGTPRLVADSCPHMGLPLSMGSVDGERVRCRYHGWTFSTDTGLVVDQPTLRRPQACRLERHGALVHGGLVFGWIGDPDGEAAARAQLPPRIPEHFSLHRTTMEAPYYLALFNAVDYAHFARHSLYAPVYSIYRALRRDGHVPGQPFHWEHTGADDASEHLRLVEARRDLRMYVTCAEFTDEGGINRFQTFVVPVGPTRTEYWEVYSARTRNPLVRAAAHAVFRTVVVALLDTEDRDWTGRSTPNFLLGENIHLSATDAPLGAHLRRFVLPRMQAAR